MGKVSEGDHIYFFSLYTDISASFSFWMIKVTRTDLYVALIAFKYFSDFTSLP